ncbi:hypothetical protein NX059_012148 [Plenodomus lindquistii]|nr:hypothetical protein NX059_012148 [Plenodomus lindquistii]
MAALPRPNVNTQGNTTFYQSFDSRDEHAYNAFVAFPNTLAVQVAFITFINDCSDSDRESFNSGAQICYLFQRDKDHWLEITKGNPFHIKPAPIADPPLPVGVADGTESPEPKTPSRASSLYETEQSPFFRGFRQEDESIEPTRGQRLHMCSELGPRWRFAAPIHNATTTNKISTGANWLLVRVSDKNLIDAHRVAKFIRRAPNADMGEIKMNKRLAKSEQILAFHGHSKRKRRKFVIHSEPVAYEEIFTYTEFAPLGTLESITHAHAAK